LTHFSSTQLHLLNNIANTIGLFHCKGRLPTDNQAIDKALEVAIMDCLRNLQKTNPTLLLTAQQLKKAERDARYVPAVASSIASIISRSENTEFQQQMVRLIRSLGSSSGGPDASSTSDGGNNNENDEGNHNRSYETTNNSNGEDSIHLPSSNNGTVVGNQAQMVDDATSANGTAETAQQLLRSLGENIEKRLRQVVAVHDAPKPPKPKKKRSTTKSKRPRTSSARQVGNDDQEEQTSGSSQRTGNRRESNNDDDNKSQDSAASSRGSLLSFDFSAGTDRGISPQKQQAGSRRRHSNSSESDDDEHLLDDFHDDSMSEGSFQIRQAVRTANLLAGSDNESTTNLQIGNEDNPGGGNNNQNIFINNDDDDDWWPE
jgi:hypothetical protein